jgi:hypothetical protein
MIVNVNVNVHVNANVFVAEIFMASMCGTAA